MDIEHDGVAVEYTGPGIYQIEMSNGTVHNLGFCTAALLHERLVAFVNGLKDSDPEERE